MIDPFTVPNPSPRELMSQQLSPQQQREVRARFGADVQQMGEAIVATPPDLSRRNEVKADDLFLKEAYKAHIKAAATMLREGAPGCALDILDAALKL